MRTAVMIAALAAVVLLAGSAGAESTRVTITVTRLGIDAAGFSAFERIELRGDGTVLWSTAARGNGCGPVGGRYASSTESAEFERARALAKAIIDDAKDRPASPGRSSWRELRTSLLVEEDGAVRSGELTFSSEVTRALEELLATIKGRAKPIAVLKLAAHFEHGGLSVKLTHEGTDPVTIVIPDDPNEVFRVEPVGGKMSWPSRRVDETFELSPAKRVAEYRILGGPANRSAATIRYSNVTVRHHGEDTPAHKAHQLDLNLCAPLGK